MYQTVNMMMAVMEAMATTTVGTTTRGIEISQLAPAYPPSQLEHVPSPNWPVIIHTTLDEELRQDVHTAPTIIALSILASTTTDTARAKIARRTCTDVRPCTVTSLTLGAAERRTRDGTAVTGMYAQDLCVSSLAERSPAVISTPPVLTVTHIWTDTLSISTGRITQDLLARDSCIARLISSIQSITPAERDRSQ